MNVSYDHRIVPAHGEKHGPKVYLVNEAPSQNEAEAGIPLFGQQGANLFHAFHGAGIAWTRQLDKFVWPQGIRIDQSRRHVLKATFLSERAKHVTCTNAYQQ